MGASKKKDKELALMSRVAHFELLAENLPALTPAGVDVFEIDMMRVYRALSPRRKIAKWAILGVLGSVLIPWISWPIGALIGAGIGIHRCSARQLRARDRIRVLIEKIGREAQ